MRLELEVAEQGLHSPAGWGLAQGDQADLPAGLRRRPSARWPAGVLAKAAGKEAS